MPDNVRIWFHIKEFHIDQIQQYSCPEIFILSPLVSRFQSQTQQYANRLWVVGAIITFAPLPMIVWSPWYQGFTYVKTICSRLACIHLSLRLIQCVLAVLIGRLCSSNLARRLIAVHQNMDPFRYGRLSATTLPNEPFRMPISTCNSNKSSPCSHSIVHRIVTPCWSCFRIKPSNTQNRHWVVGAIITFDPVPVITKIASLMRVLPCTGNGAVRLRATLERWWSIP